MDPQKTPKAKRLDTGFYKYTPLDVDTYPHRFGDSYLIAKVTTENIDEYVETLKTQWEYDPLSDYDDDEL